MAAETESGTTGRSLLATDLGVIWRHFCALSYDGKIELELELGLLVGVGISRMAPIMAEVITIFSLSLSLSRWWKRAGNEQERDTRHTRERVSTIQIRE
jgi:hypothetical protein